MKTKYLIIVGLILAILTIGAVSASENITSDDTLAVEDAADDVDVISDSGDDIIAVDDSGNDDLADDGNGSYDENDNGDKDDVDYNCDIPSSVPAVGEYEGDASMEFYINNDYVTGEISIYVDNESVYNEQIYGSYGGSFDFRNLNLTYGIHTVNLTYSGDENYNPFNYCKEFEYYYFKAEVPEIVLLGEDCMRFTFAYDAKGWMDLIINDEKKATYNVYSKRMDEEMGLRSSFYVWFDDLDLAFGEYNYTVNYYSGNYDNKTIKGTFFIEDYKFSVYSDEEDCIIPMGRTTEFYIYLPDNAVGPVILTVNNKTYTINKEDRSGYEFSEFAYGENLFVFSYSDDMYPEKEVECVITVQAYIETPEDYWLDYTSQANVSIILPADAQGNLTVYKAIYDDDLEDYVAGDVYKTSEVVDGKAVISISDLPLGICNFIAKYTGDDYDVYDASFDLKVVPKVEYPSGIPAYSDDEYNVTVTVPADTSGNFIIALYGSEYQYEEDYGYYTIGDLIEELYNDEINGTVSVALPKLDEGHYFLKVSHEEIAFEDVCPIVVKDADPNWEISVDIPEVVDFDEGGEGVIYYYPHNIPRGANGRFTLYVDGKEVDHVTYDTYDGWMSEDFEAYIYVDAGEHNWTLAYANDIFYNPTSVNGTFIAVYSLPISILYGDSEVIMDGDWMYDILIGVKAPKDFTGTFRFEINDDVFIKQTTDLENYTIEDDFAYYYFTYADFDEDWAVGNYEIHLVISDEDDVTVWSEDEDDEPFIVSLYEGQIAGNDNVSIEVVPSIIVINENDILIKIKADDTTGNVTVYIADSETPVSIPLADCTLDDDTGYYLIGSKDLGINEEGTYDLEVSYSDVSLNATVNLISNVRIYLPYEDEVIYTGYGFNEAFIQLRLQNGEIDEKYMTGLVTVTITIDGEDKVVFEKQLYELDYFDGPRADVIRYSQLDLDSDLNGTYTVKVRYNGGTEAATEAQADVNFKLFGADDFEMEIKENITSRYDYLITFTYIPDVDGYIFVYVDDDHYFEVSIWELREFADEEGAHISFGPLVLDDVGTYEMKVYFKPYDDVEQLLLADTTINVNISNEVNIEFEDIVEYGEGSIIASVSTLGDSCYAILYIDGYEYDSDLTYEGKRIFFSSGDLAVGNHTALIEVYTDEYGEFIKNATAEFEVRELIGPDLSISIADITVGEEAVVVITADEAFSGNVSVEIAGETYTVVVTNGTGSISVSDLDVGEYTAVAMSEKTAIFSEGYDEASFSVNEISLVDPCLEINVEDITVGEVAVIEISTIEDFSGNVTVEIDGAFYTVVVTNGEGSVTVPGLAVGDYTAVATLEETDVFSEGINEDSFSVNPIPLIDPNLTISVEDIFVGSDAVVVITTNKTFSGNVSVEIAGATYNVVVVDGEGSVPVSGLAVNTYTAVATFAETDVFFESVKNDTFAVNAIPLIDPDLSISVADIYVGSDAVVVITTNKTFSGNVSVEIAGAIYTVVVVDGEGSVPVSGLAVNNYIAVATFAETDVFFESVKNDTFAVNPIPLIDPDLSISVADIYVGSDAVVVITTNKTFSGNVSVEIAGAIYTVVVVDGEGSVPVSGLAVNNYIAVATFAETDVFFESVKNDTFAVNVIPLIDPDLSISVADIYVGSDAVVVITTNKTFSGNVSVEIAGAIYTVVVVDGEGSVPVSGLAVNNYTAVATFAETDVFFESVKNDTFAVNAIPPVDPNLGISIADITEGSDAVITVTTNATFSGNVTVKINNATYTVAVTNGAGSLPVSGLTAGNYTATATFAATEAFIASTKNATFTVKAKEVPPVITPVATVIMATGVTTTYGTSKNIVVVLKDANGVPIAGKNITIVFKDDTKILTTDGVGKVSYAISAKLAPGKYEATIKFNGDASYVGSKTSAKVTVKKAKSILVAKNKSFNYRKSKKKYTVILKTDKKKPLAKVKVTLKGKYNGKKIKITKKTKANGKVTFVLKKLTKKGTFKPTVKFAGNKNYKRITKRPKLTFK